MSLADPEPPRRWSVDDPGWLPSEACCISVFLNGMLVRNVIAYDCEAGTVTMYMLNNAGRFVLVPEGDMCEEYTATGEVVARWNSNRPRFDKAMALFRRMLRVGELMCLAGNRPRYIAR